MKHYKISLTLGMILFCTLVFSQKTETQEESDFIIRKGRFYSSLNFSLNAREAENEDQLLRQVVDQDKLEYRIIANGGYAIKNNMTLGLAAAYGRAKEDLTTLDDNGNEVTSKKLEQSLSLAPTMRNYIPIGKGQFQILVQTELGVVIGESLQRIFRVDDIDKVEGDFIEFGLGVSPGLVLFFDRHWAFETTVGIAGFSTRIEEEITNGDENSRQRIVESGVDLRLNLLQLKLGVAYYF